MARKYINDLTAEALRESVKYCANTGIFFSRKCGRPLGLNKGTYSKIWVNNRSWLAHRLAWLYAHGVLPSKMIDHIDGDPRNNAIENLREVSDIENHQNTKCKGFYFRSKDSVWCAQIKVNKKKIHLGSFKTPEDARAGYESAARKYFGEFNALHRGMK